MHIAYMAWALLVASEATIAFKQPLRSIYNLRIEICYLDYDYLHIHVLFAYLVSNPMVALEPTRTASKQARR